MVAYRRVDTAPPPPPPTAEEVLLSSAFAAPQATYSTGFVALDRLCDGGFKARQLTVVAAPPGSGKTGLALGWARQLSRYRPVLYVSTELEVTESAARAAAPDLGRRPSELLSLAANPAEAAHAIAGVPIYLAELDGPGSGGIPAIWHMAENIKRTTGVAPAVVVDYMQAITPDDPDAKRLSVTAVAGELRRLARDLDAPVVAVSTTGRAFYGANGRKLMEGEEDPRAWLAAAKESGDIEYAAAVFLYLDTSDVVTADGDASARLIVAKSRRGRVGFVGLTFHGALGYFSERAGALGEMGPARREAMMAKAIIAAVAATRPAPIKEYLRNGGVPGFRGKDVADMVDTLAAAGDLIATFEQRPNAAMAMRAVKVFYVPGGAK